MTTKATQSEMDSKQTPMINRMPAYYETQDKAFWYTDNNEKQKQEKK